MRRYKGGIGITATIWSEKMKNWARANKGFLLFLMLFGLFRTAVADWNPVPSGSMRPNLLEGDVVFVNRLAFDLKLPLTNVILTRLGEPKRGDVATFSSPTDGTRLIKRIIALPGDVVEMHDEQLVINGQALGYTLLSRSREPLAQGGTTAAVHLREAMGGEHHQIQVLPQVEARRNFAPLTIPDGQFMMLGDNRDNSADSRYIGLVPRALLIGRAERVLVSADIKGNWAPRTERFGMRME
jgi:signal peptidase I